MGKETPNDIPGFLKGLSEENMRLIRDVFLVLSCKDEFSALSATGLDELIRVELGKRAAILFAPARGSTP